MEPRRIVLWAFVVITVLTALAVLAAALKIVPNPDDRLIAWGIPAVLGEIAATLVMFFRGSWRSALRVNVRFGEHDPADIKLDSPQCRYKVLDRTGKTIREGTVGPTFGLGGWQIELPVAVEGDQGIALELRTLDGGKWEVRPFLPLVHTQTAMRLE